MPRSKRLQLSISLGACALMAIIPAVVRAAPLEYVSHLGTINHSGVTGDATAFLDGTDLTVNLHATGLEPNQPHPIHIHGFGADGIPSPIPSVLPTTADDTDHDGFIELAEGQVRYGPIILNIASGSTPTGPDVNPVGQFPTAPNGIIDFHQTYHFNLSDSNQAKIFNLLQPLNLREFVIHGMTVAAGVGLDTPGEVDGTPGYKAVLPVADGLIRSVPEPASIALFSTGLLGIGWLARRRQRYQLETMG